MLPCVISVIRQQSSPGLQLCDGASEAERQSWQLGSSNEYHYLNQSSCFELKDVDNAEEYKVR